MIRLSKAIGLSALVVLMCSVDSAEAKKFVKLADLSTGGGAKEVACNADAVSIVRIVCTEGHVIINTVVVREGGKKTPHTVARRLEKGQNHAIQLGSPRKVTGIRISDDGNGKYVVQVRR